MTHVFLLTESGNGFNDQGTDILTEHLREDGLADPKIIFDMGQRLKDPTHLADLLNMHPDAWIIVESDEHSTTILPESIPYILDWLQAYPNQDSWMTIVNGLNYQVSP